MRTTEAAQCNVRSVLLLPLFGDPERSSTIGVVEVAQSTDKMPFGNVVTALAAAFKVRYGTQGCAENGLAADARPLLGVTPANFPPPPGHLGP